MLERKVSFEEPGYISHEHMVEYSEAVVYIQVNSWKGKKIQNPTSASGFLFTHGEISGLMTCYHAIPTKEDARFCRVFIGPEASFAATNGPNELKQVVLEPNRLFFADKTLDYTIIGVRDDSSNPAMKYMKLWHGPTPHGAEICLLHHPKGEKRKRSVGKITKFENNYVFYNINTNTGSSGGPVMLVYNKTWWVVGIHIAAFNDDANRATYMKLVVENLHYGNDSTNRLFWILSNWEKAYGWCNLAPPFSFETDPLCYFDDVQNLTFDDLQKVGFLRLADGGWVDNTSVSYLISHLQARSSRVVCLFMNDVSTTRCNSQIAKLFGHKSRTMVGLVTANSQVFEKQEINDPLWSYSKTNSDQNVFTLNYYYYDATTVLNMAFGISKGDAYELHIFTMACGGSGPIPMTELIMDSYTEIFNETRNGVRDHGGWTHLQKVFNSPHVSLAFSGGGWLTHTALAGWIAGSLDKDETSTVAAIFQNVDVISCNSGGSWFLSQLAYSKVFLDALQNDRDNWVTTGYLGQTRELFKPYWCAEDKSTTLVDLSNWDSITNQLLEQLIKSRNKNFDEVVNCTGILGGLYSGWKMLNDCDMNWRSFVYKIVYGPWDMADAIGKLTFADLTSRNSWATNKEFIIAAAVLGGKDVLVTKLQEEGVNFVAYELSPHWPSFFPLVFKNDGYHTYKQNTLAQYWDREQKLFKHLDIDEFQKIIKTAGNGNCPVLDVCVVSSAGFAPLASAAHITMYIDAAVAAAVIRGEDVKVPVPDEATNSAPEPAEGKSSFCYCEVV